MIANEKKAVVDSGWDNVISWSGNHHTLLVTKTWLPDALLRGCPSTRARSARGAGC
eukprot:COSAG06_NODE_9541_length_1875_cov_1.640203_1_plen_55_part_10